MEERTFRLEEHYFVKACEKAGIVEFPITKNEAEEMAGGIMVRTDFNEYTPLSSLIHGFARNYFENGAAFRNAYVSFSTEKLRRSLWE